MGWGRSDVSLLALIGQWDRVPRLKIVPNGCQALEPHSHGEPAAVGPMPPASQPGGQPSSGEDNRVFKSFFLAGFECATGYNRHGEWIDQVAATHHDVCASEDYRLLREAGIYGARESIRWPLVDHGGRYDFSSVEPHLAASQEYGVEVIWDLFHYGYPDDVDLFSPDFPRRFADYCYAAAAGGGAP